MRVKFAWREWQRRAGFDRLYPFHSLRHTAVTNVYRAICSDLTTVPTALGFWVPWLPNSLPPVWPFCWCVAVVVDHFSRRLVTFEVFFREPRSSDLKTLLDGAIRGVGKTPYPPDHRPGSAIHRGNIPPLVSPRPHSGGGLPQPSTGMQGSSL